MLNTHEHYEELCALAASGQASADELTELRSHTEDCPTCRKIASDFMEISALGLAPLAEKGSRSQIPSGMSGRFLARARSEGIGLSRKESPEKRTPGGHVLVAALIAAVAAALLISAFLSLRNRKPQPRKRDLVQMPLQPKLGPSTAVSQNAEAEEARLQQQVVSAQEKMRNMENSIRALRTELDSVNTARSSLNSRLLDAKRENERIQSEKAQWETQAAQLEADIQKSRSEKNASDTTWALQQAELSELRNKLSEESEALQQQEALAAQGIDVRELVVARNLHIIDVHDRDGNGKSQRAFGRIFYTEGKSLIFYAYDLADPRKLDAKVSFYVWGERLGAEKPVRSLGIFHNDDATDGRWVLTFDDPQVLAQINSVFVTVESTKKSIKQPGGRRILFAFLGDKPNHP